MTSSSVNEINCKLSSTLTSSIGINRATLSSINEITTLVNGITTFVKPTPSSQSIANNSEWSEVTTLIAGNLKQCHISYF